MAEATVSELRGGGKRITWASLSITARQSQKVRNKTQGGALGKQTEYERALEQAT